MTDTPNVLAVLFGDGQCERVRIKLPYQVLSRQGYKMHWVHQDKMSLIERNGVHYDLNIAPRIYMSDLAAAKAIVQNTRAAGQMIVYETDDDYNHLESWNPAYAGMGDGQVEAMNYLMTHADAVTVSTPYLRQQCLPYNQNVYVLPNSLDFSAWDAMTPQAREIPGLTIGWYGGDSHAMDFAILEDVLPDIVDVCPDVTVVLGGYNTWKIRDSLGDRVKVIPWLPINRFPAIVKQIDIGLIPLLDSTFNRSKSQLKWLEMSALGIPCVVSPAGPYREVQHGVTGFQAGDRKAWIRYTRDLVRDRALRKRIGQAAHTYVRARYDIRKNASLWLRAYQEIWDKRKQGESHG